MAAEIVGRVFLFVAPPDASMRPRRMAAEILRRPRPSATAVALQ